MIIVIAATDSRGVIGNGDKLPWHIPNELKHFKETTLHQTVVMGRKTFEGVGKLPDRKFIVLSRGEHAGKAGVEYVNSIEPILERSKTEDIYIAGGEKIYRLFLPYADKVIITRIKANFIGDVYFPSWDEDAFFIECLKMHAVTKDNPHEYTISYYKKHAQSL